MPSVDPTVGMPYATIGDIMNVARARVNDMMNDTAGDLLANDAPASQTYLSAAWRWYQDRCSTVGVETLIKSVTLTGMPIQQSVDVANEAFLTWLGCSDGLNEYDSPALPQDLIQPLSIWRRISIYPIQGEDNINQFCLMRQAEDGLPTWRDCDVFDWRDDGIYFYAPAWVQDFRIRYSAYRADLDITQPANLVPMMRCQDALGARVAFEFASARGAAQAPAMETWAENAFQTGAAQRTSRRKQRQSIRRQPYNSRGGYRQWPQYTNSNY